MSIDREYEKLLAAYQAWADLPAPQWSMDPIEVFNRRHQAWIQYCIIRDRYYGDRPTKRYQAWATRTLLN